MGGAVAMRYTSLYPEDVERLVLVAPAGFDEPWHRLSQTGPTVSMLRTQTILPLRLRAKLSLIQDTPRYQNLVDWFASATARQTPTLLVYAAFDELHRADKWATCRSTDRTFRMRRIPVTHPLLCAAITLLRLDLDPAAWHDLHATSAAGDREGAVEVNISPLPQPRARL